jgi:hypothetical protein
MGVKLGLSLLRKEHRLRVFENSRLKRIFGPKREKVLGSYRELHNKELHKLYYSRPGITRMMKSRGVRRAGHITYKRGRRNKCIQHFCRKPFTNETTWKTE